MNHPQLALCQLAICHLPFAICHLPSAICHLPFAICHLPFAICHLPFAICHLPFATCPLPIIDMTNFTLPPPLLDPSTLPPAILTSEPGSFAQDTLKVRVPAILRETIALNDFPADIRQALNALHAELVDGVIRGLTEDAADRAFWDPAGAAFVGRSWLDLPWYWAEAFFYRRVLEATRYFQPGPWQGFDPYDVKKRTEWAPDAAPAAVDALLTSLPVDPAARFERLLHASLWGNRTDLSYPVAAHLGATGERDAERDNLLADDTAIVWDYLTGAGRERLAILADNAGTELLLDLALIDGLLADGLAQAIHLHLKPQPFFVSDALPKDVLAGLTALPGGGAAAAGLAARLRAYLADGRLRLTTHWHSATSLFYFQLPADLAADLARMDLVIVKGDANYRRLLGDAHWSPTTPFAQATAYFPAPLVALRTLKGEIIVGLREGEAERLTAEDPAWLVNGQRGVIQAQSEIRTRGKVSQKPGSELPVHPTVA